MSSYLSRFFFLYKAANEVNEHVSDDCDEDRFDFEQRWNQLEEQLIGFNLLDSSLSISKDSSSYESEKNEMVSRKVDSCAVPTTVWMWGWIQAPYHGVNHIEKLINLDVLNTN